MNISPGDIGWLIWLRYLDMASLGQINQLWILFEQNRCVLDILLPLKSNKSANKFCVVLPGLQLLYLFLDFNYLIIILNFDRLASHEEKIQQFLIVECQVDSRDIYTFKLYHFC